MNKLKGEIIRVETSDEFSVVQLEVQGHTFLAIVIASSSINPILRKGNFIYLLFKETDVTLSNVMPEFISISNKFLVTVKVKETGILLSRVIVDFNGIELKAVVPSHYAQSIQIGDKIALLVRANEIMLMEIN